MKTLVYIRHGHKTPDNHITEQTKPLIVVQVKRIDNEFYIEQVHYGELIRTKETAETAAQELDDPTVLFNEPWQGIGSDAMFAEMITPAFRDRVKEGMSNFEALKAVHPEALFTAWCTGALQALAPLFEGMESDGNELLCGHSPIIEMAAYAAGGFEFSNPSFSSLKEVEALAFQQDDGNITVVKKFDQPNISVA